MPRDWQMFVRDMTEACEKIQRFSRGMNQDEFYANDLVHDAVLRNLTIIGEAISKVPEEVQLRYPEIEWRKIISFRNVAMHEYFGLDRDIVWDVVNRKVPELAARLTDIKT